MILFVVYLSMKTIFTRIGENGKFALLLWTVNKQCSNKVKNSSTLAWEHFMIHGAFDF